MQERVLNKADIPWIKKIQIEAFKKEIDLEPFLNSPYVTIGNEGKSFAIIQHIEDEAEIIYIAVNSKFRNMGYGDRLIKYFLENYRVDRMFLEVRADNYSAISLYEKNGFKKTGIRKAYYEDNMDAIVMERARDE